MLFTITLPLHDAVVVLMSPCLQIAVLPAKVASWWSCSGVQGGWEAEEMYSDMETDAAVIHEEAGQKTQS